jgi:hypothetical protein
MSDTPTRDTAAHSPERRSHEQDAIAVAKATILGAFDAHAAGRAGVAHLIGQLWLAADGLQEAVFEGAGSPSWAARTTVLLEANNREVERRRAAEAEVSRLDALLGELLIDISQRPAARAAAEEVAFWRRDAAARLQMAIWLHRGFEQRRNAKAAREAARIRIEVIRPTLAALDQANRGEWFERCELCGEFMRPGDERVSAGCIDGEEILAHASCAGVKTGLFVDDCDSAVIAEARALVDEPDDEAGA